VLDAYSRRRCHRQLKSVCFRSTLRNACHFGVDKLAQTASAGGWLCARVLIVARVEYCPAAWLIEISQPRLGCSVVRESCGVRAKLTSLEAAGR